jgi:hypothetical protein
MEGSMTDYVITGLVKRRAELAGEIEATHGKLKALLEGLSNLDATIQQFDPGYSPEGIRPKAFRAPKDWSSHGQMSRMVLSILRQAAEPLSTRDVAMELLVTRALDKEDQKLLKLMTKRVGVALNGQRANGTVRSEQGPGMMLLWEVAR